jgi:hypothetical protein
MDNQYVTWFTMTIPNLPVQPKNLHVVNRTLSLKSSQNMMESKVQSPECVQLTEVIVNAVP